MAKLWEQRSIEYLGRRESKLAKSTIRHEKTVIDDFIADLKNRPGFVARNHVETYVKTMKSDSKASTRNQVLQTISKFVNHYSSPGQ